MRLKPVLAYFYVPTYKIDFINELLWEEFLSFISDKAPKLLREQSVSIILFPLADFEKPVHLHNQGELFWISDI